jgi:hypothetical protein
VSCADDCGCYGLAVELWDAPTLGLGTAVGAGTSKNLGIVDTYAETLDPASPVPITPAGWPTALAGPPLLELTIQTDVPSILVEWVEFTTQGGALNAEFVTRQAFVPINPLDTTHLVTFRHYAQSRLLGVRVQNLSGVAAVVWGTLVARSSTNERADQAMMDERLRRFYDKQSGAVGAATAVYSPVYHVGDIWQSVTAGYPVNRFPVSVGAPLVDGTLNVPTASAGATWQLLGDTNQAMGGAVVLAGAAGNVAAAAIYQASALFPQRATMPFVQFRFTNGATPQAATFFMCTAAGGI